MYMGYLLVSVNASSAEGKVAWWVSSVPPDQVFLVWSLAEVTVSQCVVLPGNIHYIFTLTSLSILVYFKRVSATWIYYEVILWSTTLTSIPTVGRRDTVIELSLVASCYRNLRYTKCSSSLIIVSLMGH